VNAKSHEPVPFDLAKNQECLLEVMAAGEASCHAPWGSEIISGDVSLVIL